MSALATPLEGVSVVNIDIGDAALKLEAAFAASGAALFVVDNLQSSLNAEPSFIPDVAVIDPGTIDHREIRRLFRSANEPRCRLTFYEDQWPEHHYGAHGMVDKSTPIADVVAVSGIRQRSQI
ncbi:hypothetical protein E0H71_00380 [Rhizobium leguminosarum bv. viciae]|uniref:hypothetical protein n=1 Tax=Rhizobium leguminosarum TaxID=384 RepID=UPI0010391B15|nr:hypothetical protein [Rhizobium leguminosarum]TCA58092.1 hypothetical protein E0H71_00380 [Rhizobium leguminosarum bv. viciae]